MARMIPAQYDESTSSNAEKRLFNLFKNDPDTEAWVVLHSLGLSKRSKKPYGEIDFVVLVPEAGLVCLEVKGGRVTCKDGVWYTTNRQGVRSEMKRSPFMQAREGMFALRQELNEKFGPNHPASKCLTGYAAVFPDVQSPPKTPEFESWESIDRDSFKRPISRVITGLLRQQRRKLGPVAAPSDFTPKTIREIQQFLRPDFEVVVSHAALVSQAEEKLLKLTEEQYDILDRLEDNRRCLIKGPAGTGKTLLSLEFARRLSRADTRTLFVCFNRVLGDWLSDQTAGLSGIQCGSYHRFIRKQILDSPHAEEFQKQMDERAEEEIWEDIFPFYGELVGSEAGSPFEVLVIDEAQDLLNTQTMDVLNVWLSGGLSGGRWLIAGDFSSQAIYSANGSARAEELLEEYCPHYTSEKLTLNCRNTKQIAEETTFLSGFTASPYRLGHVEGLAVDYRYWRDLNHQAQILVQVIQKMLDEGIEPKDIALLSPKRFARSVVSRVSEAGAIEIQEIGNPVSETGNRITFSTIHSFKGMESKVIIMCDIEAVNSTEPQSLLYVGMSRARSHLTVLLSSGTRSYIQDMMFKKLKDGWQ